MASYRPQGPGYFHVITRGTGGTAYFRDDDDRIELLHLLCTTADRLGWTLYAYCLMTTHYHVVLGTTASDLGAGMQRINSRYVQGFNNRWDRFGTLVAERYRSRVIESEEYLTAACRYVFLNPVRAEACGSVSGWPWSGGAYFKAASSL